MNVKNNLVFAVSLLIVLLVSLVGVVSPEGLDRWSKILHSAIIRNFGWSYLLSSFLFLVFSLYMAFSRYGEIKLGGDHEKPRFSYFGWFSMLFAAGMGIGLIFWGVAEPMSHYLNPPDYIQAASPEAAKFAMRYSFFHWGIHPWAIYIVMSLSIAYFSFRRGMPPLISSCFYPLIGDRIHGPAGYFIDILAVFATVFGIVTSLGLGAMQINSGLASILPIEASFTSTLVIIATVTVLFIVSSMTGLDRGIQVLSKANIMLALTILGFMFLVGPTNTMLNIFISTLADYASNLFTMSLSTNPFRGAEWTQNWTLFYWAWWISWSPFVGLFVASISRGRTIREFVTGALMVPALLTFLWFSVFGGAAFHLELEKGGGHRHGSGRGYLHGPVQALRSLPLKRRIDSADRPPAGGLLRHLGGLGHLCAQHDDFRRPGKPARQQKTDLGSDHLRNGRHPPLLGRSGRPAAHGHRRGPALLGHHAPAVPVPAQRGALRVPARTRATARALSRTRHRANPDQEPREHSGPD